jgi:hypothetical protein
MVPAELMQRAVTVLADAAAELLDLCDELLTRHAFEILVSHRRSLQQELLFVRQLRDMKVAGEVETFKRRTLLAYATLETGYRRVRRRRFFLL